MSETVYRVARDDLWYALDRLRAVYRAHYPAIDEIRRFREDIRSETSGDFRQMLERTTAEVHRRVLSSSVWDRGEVSVQLFEHPDDMLILRLHDAAWHELTGADVISALGLTALLTSAPHPGKRSGDLGDYIDGLISINRYVEHTLIDRLDLEVLALRGNPPWVKRPSR